MSRGIAKLNISRTQAPESWLGNISKSAKMDLKAVNKRAVITSQFSVSTIDTQLFPELLSWSAVMEAQAPSRHSQHIPSDICKADDIDSLLENDESISLSLIIDPTSIEFGFDASCLNGLDNLLIQSPIHAFAESCWSEVISPPPSDRARTPTLVNSRSPHVTNHSSLIELEVDSDSHETYQGMHSVPHRIPGNDVCPDVRTVGEFTSYDEQNSYFHAATSSSFMLFEPHSHVSNPQDSIGCFPIPAPKNKTMQNRLAAFCSNLPAFVKAT